MGRGITTGYAYGMPEQRPVASVAAPARGRPVRTPDIGELRAFCAAADLGSVTRAARLLRLSQPALSKRLAALEALAGVRLLERSTRGVSATPAGMRLYAEARRLLAQAEIIEDLMTGLTDQDAPVRFAASHTLAEFILPDVLVAYERRHERQLSVEMVVANSGIVRRLVAEGRVEVGAAALSDDTHADVVQIPFLDDELVVAAPSAHPWALAGRVDLAELIATPLVVRDPGADGRKRVDRRLSELGVGLTAPLAEVGSTSAAIQTALTEGAPTVMSRIALERLGVGLHAVEVPGLSVPRRFAVVLGGSPETLRPAARALVAHIVPAGA